MTARQEDQGWCGNLHTAEDIAERAIDLGLEAARAQACGPGGRNL